MTGRPVVIDASVALAIVLDEPRGDSAIRLIRTWSQTRHERVVPRHFWYELINALGRRHQFTGEQMMDAVFQAERFGLRTVDPDRGTLFLAIDRTERLGLSAYDALYLAVAESLKADLATFDRALAAAAGSLAIRFDEDNRRLHETAWIYEHDVTWPNHKATSAYLAQLRAEALAGRG